MPARCGGGKRGIAHPAIRLRECNRSKRCCQLLLPAADQKKKKKQFETTRNDARRCGACRDEGHPRIYTPAHGQRRRLPHGAPPARLAPKAEDGERVLHHAHRHTRRKPDDRQRRQRAPGSQWVCTSMVCVDASSPLTSLVSIPGLHTGWWRTDDRRGRQSDNQAGGAG